MKNGFVIILIFVLSFVAGISAFFYFNKTSEDYSQNLNLERMYPSGSTAPAFATATPFRAVISPTISIATATPVVINNSDMAIIADVPFTSQAPDGDWANQMFQYGCEEASMLMAIHWARGTAFTKEEAIKEITAISELEIAKYGGFYDRSAFDTTQLIKDYYGYQNVVFRADVTTEDIKTEIKKGNILIIPMNGTKLMNPHFRAGGPEEHMLVVIGYDPSTDEFVTNDPGTRFGKGYRYPVAVFMEAIRDYLTGNKEPFGQLEKNMIVVSK
jgi:hypothetical protein